MGMESMTQQPTIIALITILLVLISVISGVYLFFLAMWELRTAENRKKYTDYIFYAVLLTLILPVVITLFVNTVLM